MLHAPDFLGYADAHSRWPRDHRELVEGALRLKKIGNEIMRVLGGREIHPINVRVGGFYRAPTAAELARARAELLECAREVARGGALHRLASRPATSSRSSSSSRSERRVPDGEGTAGLEQRPRHRRRRSTTSTSPRSTWSTPPRCTRGCATARQLPRRAAGALRAQLRPALAGGAQAAAAGPAEPVVPQPLPQHRRAHGGDRVRARRGAAHASTPTSRRTRRRSRSRRAPVPGCGWTEAPRGMLYHRYELDDDGTILDARIVPPTSQNQRTIEEDLRAFVELLADLPDDRAAPALRAGDPQLRPVHLLRDALPAARGGPTALTVIGVGNPLRGDDGAGLEVARRLRERSGGRRAARREGDRAALLACGRGRASWSSTPPPRARPPGTVHRFDAARRARCPRQSPLLDPRLRRGRGAVELARVARSPAARADRLRDRGGQLRARHRPHARGRPGRRRAPRGTSSALGGAQSGADGPGLHARPVGARQAGRGR